MCLLCVFFLTLPRQPGAKRPDTLFPSTTLFRSQAKARLDALNARIATEGRRLDTRRKIILGGLLLDAATKDQRFAGIVSELNGWLEAERSEEHTSELQSLMRISYAVFCLKKKTETI